MMLNKKNGRSLVVILIFLAAIFVAVNLWIKKTIDAGQPKPQPVKSEVPVKAAEKPYAQNSRIAAPIVSNQEKTVVKTALPASPKAQKPPEVKDNNIIYEPSIKGNILLQ
ncbi:MAG TPA: hypothetical protein PL155_05855 [Candidatus Omnitrophota bacterium]|nr:hypothetical protein [Candidatus Omnitrophota bacterium]HPD83996.1 hypothetical protein [Candidatus Omnitrophota bacterium]HRZ02853.1 hypothetical protein [Candidatus Omnitrophota bacterium]